MSLTADLRGQLLARSRQMRVEILKMVFEAQSGHPSGSLGICDLICALYFHQLRVDPSQPRWPLRDRFVLSKGHNAPALYAALALRGFFPVSELATLRRVDSRLQGHPDMKKCPGVDMSTGSLGQGVSTAVGMALGARVLGAPFRVYALMSDGEQASGQVWEAAMAAAHYRLCNLTCLIDRNGVQTDGQTAAVMGSAVLEEKWAAFGWNVRTCPGHDFDALCEGLAALAADRERPGVLICDTVSGKGVSFLERKTELYGENLDRERYERALQELTAP